MLNDVPLRDLQVFCAVVRHGSFSAAAQATGLAQTYISKRIKLLEASLGVKLLHRTTRRVKVAAEGQVVHHWAQRMLRDAQALEAELSGQREVPKGVLRVCASQRLGRRHLAPILGLLMQAHPELSVWLELMDRRVDLVEEGFDVDIRVGHVEEPGLIPHHIASTPRILCAAPGYLASHGVPARPQDLSRHACMVFRDRDDAFGVWRLKGPKGWEMVKVNSQLASNDSEVALRWALAGHGVVMMADWNMEQALASGELVRVLPKWNQPADVWAVTVARSDQSAKVRVCIEFLRQHLATGANALRPAAC